MKSHLYRQQHRIVSRTPTLSTMALAISLSFPFAAQAATYDVTDVTSFNAAMATINTNGDANAVIRLQGDITTTFGGGNSLTQSTVPVTIDTNGHQLIRGDNITSWQTPLANHYTFKGNFAGADVAIAGNGNAGLQLSTTGGSVTIDGNVTGGANAGAGAGGAGVNSQTGARTIINNGNIKGGEGTNGAAGIVAQVGAQIVNTGTIEGGDANGGTAGSGIGFGNSTTSSIINSGTIRGGSELGGGTTGGTGISVALAATLFTIQNTGTIEGGDGAVAIRSTTGNVTIINSGNITAGADAGGGRPNAITKTGGRLNLELRAGSNIDGIVDAGAGTTDALIFGGTANSTFNATDIGTQYLNFENFTKTGSSTWTLNGNATGTGAWAVDEGKLVLNSAITGSMNVNAAGTLGGNATINGDVTNSGIIAPGNSIGTILINGNYTGNGGTLEMEGQFAGTGSPADKLLITGNATGTTTIKAINVGGTGAATGTGNTDGISIVQVAGTSSATAFQLAGGYVAAGPYQYQLRAFDPASSAASEIDPSLGAGPFYDYRLQSLLDASGNPVAVPQIAAYQGISTGATRYGASLLDSIHKRLGELRRSSGAGGGSDGQNNEFFLRAQGFSNDVSGSRSAGYDQDIWFTQAGGNVFGKDMEDGATLRIGGAFSYGESKLNVDNSSAKVNLEGTTLAVTSTYQAANGWYLDGAVQVTKYSADIRTGERGQTGSPDGMGYGLSLEGGYPIDLGNNVIIEPQAQLAYQKINFDRFRDVDGIAVDLRDGESLRGRFGGRLQKTFDANTTRAWSPYIEANLLHEFLDGGSIHAGNVSFATDSLGTSVQLGGGVNAQFGANKMLFASVGYESGLSHGAADAWSGNIGMRINW